MLNAFNEGPSFPLCSQTFNSRAYLKRPAIEVLDVDCRTSMQCTSYSWQEKLTFSRLILVQLYEIGRALSVHVWFVVISLQERLLLVQSVPWLCTAHRAIWYRHNFQPMLKREQHFEVRELRLIPAVYNQLSPTLISHGIQIRSQIRVHNIYVQHVSLL